MAIVDAIKTIAADGEVCWIGNRSVIKSEEITLRSSSICRAAPCHHGNYDLVVHIDEPLPADNWELILDEMTRLSKDKGYILIRIKQNPTCTIPLVKSQLNRNPLLKATLIKQEIRNDGDYLLLIEIDSNRASHKNHISWSFVVLSDGKRTQNLQALYNSINTAPRGKTKEIELIIIGPQVILDLDPKSEIVVKNIDLEDFLDKKHLVRPDLSLARIAQKKNLGVKASKHQNIALIHDRYILENNFFTGFDKYGYSFDLVAPLQSFETGENYPCIPRFRIPILTWQTPIQDKSQHNIYPGTYINGGFFVGKKNFLEVVGLNDLLLHNEAEDVEFSYICRSFGVIPRFNPYSRVTTIGVTNLHTQAFEASDISPSSEMTRLLTTLNNKKPSKLRLSAQSARPIIRKLLFYLALLLNKLASLMHRLSSMI